MRFQTRSRHVIDVIFPIALFFVFAASALAVLLLAANLYSSSTVRSQANDESRTVLSYLSEKMKHNDNGTPAELLSVDGTDCLRLSSSYEDSLYYTYIYDYDGALRELFVKADVEISLKSGKKVMDVSSLTISKPEDGLFYFSSTDRQGHTDSRYVSERSGNEREIQ